ncbi:MAG: glycosyltransferase [Blastocatellia bacterium]|nr:glycosyltransferase [Blastocatellia bacterium]
MATQPPTPDRGAASAQRGAAWKALAPLSGRDDGAALLQIVLETELPVSLPVGGGNLFYLAGGCFSRDRRIERVEVIVNGTATSATAHSIDRPDLAEAFAGDQELFRQARECGFWALVRVPPVESETEAGVDLRVTSSDGARLIYRLGTIALAPGLVGIERDTLPAPSSSAAGQLRVTICMATHNPPLELFRRQIESIRGQSYENWTCIISDDASAPEALAGMREILGEDARFALMAFSERKGFYHNFERALSLAPADSVYIALSDQDDFWYPEKLGKLVDRFDSETMLVYSDMRIVAASGAVLSDTYWTTRANNSTDFCSLLLANSVTGAASLFRRELLGQCLPFPTRVGYLFHDHWIAVMAMLMGKIAYVDEPLYDYIQHGANIIGHAAPLRPPFSRMIIESFRAMRSVDGRRMAREIYLAQVLKIRAMSSAALMRVGDGVRRGRRRTLLRLASLDRSVYTLVWLMLRGLKDRGAKSVTIGAEYHLSLGVMWKHYVSWRRPPRP